MAVITTEQLTQVATAQKSYIDTKDKELKDLVSAESTARGEALTAQKTELEQKIANEKAALQDSIDAIVVPEEATDAKIKEITDIFATVAAE